MTKKRSSARVSLLVRRLEDARGDDALSIHEEGAGKWNSVLLLVRRRDAHVQNAVFLAHPAQSQIRAALLCRESEGAASESGGPRRDLDIVSPRGQAARDTRVIGSYACVIGIYQPEES